MQQIVSSFNLLLASIVGSSITLGMLLGEIRVRAMAFGLTAGFAIAQVLPESVLKVVPETIAGVDRKIAIIWIVAVIFVCASFVGQRHAQRSFRTIFFAIATALFGASISLVLMPVGSRQELVTNFNLAAMVYDLRTYIVLIELGLLIVFTAIPIKSKEDKKHKRKKK